MSFNTDSSLGRADRSESYLLSSILFAEYFDDTLKNQAHASKVLDMHSVGVIPKIVFATTKIPFNQITSRLLDLLLQNVELSFKEKKHSGDVKTLLFYSNQDKEGKTVVAGNVALHLRDMGKRVVFINFTSHSPSDNLNRPKMPKASILRKLLGYPDNRIDHSSDFLAAPHTYLSENEYFEIDTADLSRYGSINELVQEKLSNTSLPDYVIVEFPSIIPNQYPTELVSCIDLHVLVCRANRIWTDADRTATEMLAKFTGQPSVFVLNGVELQAIEAIFGELPKKRSKFRKAIKKLVQLQFLSQNQI